MLKNIRGADSHNTANYVDVNTKPIRHYRTVYH